MTGWGNVDAQVLRALRGASIHLLPSEIAEQLALPISEVEASIASFQNAGFEIERRPGFGARLIASPDRILADDLWSRMDDLPLAREILAFAETNSTNDVAMRLGREGHPGNIAIFAERQTAGRGRFGRRWDSAQHAGLWFSLLLRPEWRAQQWGNLTTWAALGVAQALERFTSDRAQIKWPNDVQLRGRKIAGILIESAADTQGRSFAVVGIGVNVNQDDFPEEIQNKAISLRQSRDSQADRAAVAAAILSELQNLWQAAGEDFSSLVANASARSSLLGTWVRLQSGMETVEGIAESLDERGQLQMRLPDGSLQVMMAGEVTSQLTP